MALHVSGKLFVVGLVIASLITAFSAPRNVQELDLSLSPVVVVLETPREFVGQSELGPIARPVFHLKATGYNSLVNQTDSTPFITATGARTAFGIIAVSRDLLKSDIPYGSLVRIKDLGGYHNGRGAGRFQAMLDEQTIFIVEDTMHARKRQQVDIWFPYMSDALHWGVRQVEVELIRYGRDSETYPSLLTGFEASPRLFASR